MSKEVVSKVYEAEKAADYAEIAARQRADKIIEDAEIKARDNYATAIEYAQKESICRLDNARQKGNALILSMEDRAQEQIAALDTLLQKRQEDAIKEIIESIL